MTRHSDTGNRSEQTPADDAHTLALAKVAGREGARELLLTLGADVSNPEAVKQMQRDMNFLRDLRVGTSAVKSKVMFGFVGAVVTALLAYAALYLHIPTAPPPGH